MARCIGLCLWTWCWADKGQGWANTNIFSLLRQVPVGSLWTRPYIIWRPGSCWDLYWCGSPAASSSSGEHFQFSHKFIGSTFKVTQVQVNHDSQVWPTHIWVRRCFCHTSYNHAQISNNHRIVLRLSTRLIKSSSHQIPKVSVPGPVFADRSSRLVSEPSEV